MMPSKELMPQGEIIAYGAAMDAAFQVLINCLEESDALQPGQYLKREQSIAQTPPSKSLS
jgi:hypothetical protein